MAPRKVLTIQEKANLIEEASKPGMTQAKLCEKHKIPKSTLSKILREKDSILDFVDTRGKVAKVTRYSSQNL